MNTRVTSTNQLQPVDDFDEWMVLAGDAYRRLVAAFDRLAPDDWERDTPCEGWTVRHLGQHLVGALRAASSLRETLSLQRATANRAKATGEQEVDAMTAIQIERASDLDGPAIVDELRRLMEPAVRGRRRLPRAVRRRARIPVEMGGLEEKWTLEYFLGCILTRDAWLHRIDLADTLGRAPEMDAHDRAIVGDVAAEWARRHGQPVELELTGPAGGRLSSGIGGPTLTLDAIEFCRVVSGRSPHPHPLLAQEVPF